MFVKVLHVRRNYQRHLLITTYTIFRLGLYVLISTDGGH
jgi:hypothetical protein